MTISGSHRGISLLLNVNSADYVDLLDNNFAEQGYMFQMNYGPFTSRGQWAAVGPGYGTCLDMLDQVWDMSGQVGPGYGTCLDMLDQVMVHVGPGMGHVWLDMLHIDSVRVHTVRNFRELRANDSVIRYTDWPIL